MLPEEKKGAVRIPLLIAIGITAIFGYLVMFLILNLYGS